MKVKNIYNKVTSGVVVGVAALSFCSCNDFLTITPPDKTVAEDYWKTKNDVEQMVAGAYKQMISQDIVEKSIIWGAFRSDELNKNTNNTRYSHTDLDNITAVNLTSTNGYNSWATFYNVINRCNIVLKHAQDVMSEDPTFTQSDYQAVRGQMLALRSLCYFYLVRTFRDIPYSEEAYESDDQSLSVGKSSPDEVLQKCIRDLQEAEGSVLMSNAYGMNDWRNQGYITQDAVRAILADIYLWRGSMREDSAGIVSDFTSCIDYCNKVIDAKDATFRTQNAGGGIIIDAKDKYHLIDGDKAFNQIFCVGNSRESILELPYGGISQNKNYGMQVCYYAINTNNDYTAWTNYGKVVGTQIFNTTNEKANEIDGEKAYFTTKDYRFWQNVCKANNDAETQFDIRKMTMQSELSVDIKNRVNGLDRGNYAALINNYTQNWIIYRLTDVMLMKAEASVQLAKSDTDPMLNEAYLIVKAVNERSLLEGTVEAKDTLDQTKFNSKEKMEVLVLAERCRELSFEGKRWYDLVRYNYRQVGGTSISQTLTQMGEFKAVSANMKKIMKRKYVTGGDAVSFKIKTEPYLYFPIQRRELNANLQLTQNPAYVDDNSSVKN